MGRVVARASATVVGAWDWLERHPVRGLWIAVAFSVLLRLPFLSFPLTPDEGGFLMVAQQWSGAGTSLYGDQWVDRPPLLLLIFKTAAALGGSAAALRLIAAMFAVLAVVSAWWAGKVINGSRGAVAAALVASVVGANISLLGTFLTGELIAGAFVVLSCALTLQAAYGAQHPTTGTMLALLAGISAALAFLVKQNFVDAGLFALVLLGIKAHQTWRLLVAGAVGVAVPLIAAAVWASSGEGPGLAQLWRALFQFRQRALAIIEDASSEAPVQRLQILMLLFIFAGAAFLFAQMLVAVLRVSERRSLRIAMVVMAVYGVVGVLLGASWWRHYLLQLVPVIAMGAALATKGSARRIRTHYAATYAAVATVVTAVVTLGLFRVEPGLASSDEAVADYLRSASHNGDSVFVAYGRPNIIERSGLTTPYRYSWSLPIRGRDPGLDHLVDTLRGPQAPTWLVELGSFDWWRIDTPAFQRVRDDRYRYVGDVCGHGVYLRTDVTRPPPSNVSCAPS